MTATRRPIPDHFLNIHQVAEMVGLPVKTLRNRDGGTKDIPRVKLGSRVLFSFNAVQHWMAQKVREAEEEKRQSGRAVVDLLAQKRSRQRAVQDTLTTIINGGKYK